jgi:potassium-dependent mechanosensitive channel
VISINPNCRRCCLNASRTAGACIALILAFAVTALIRPRPASAATATVEAPAERKIEAISAADIPNRADADEDFIQAAVRRSEAAERNGRFEQSLTSLFSGVKQLAGQSNGPMLSALSLRTLANLQRHWQFYEREISRWRVELHRVTKAGLEDSAGMASRRAVWRATRLVIADAAPALLQRVDETIDDIDRAAAVVSTSVTKSLDLERRGNALLARVDSEKADVLASMADQDRRLLMIDSPPLWQAASGREARKSVDVGMRESLEIDAAFGRDYDAAHISAMCVAIAGGALLLPLMLWLRYRARRAIDSGQVTAVSMHVLLRPWAAWLVLVALEEVLFGFRGPIIRQEAVIVLAWIPVLRLVPPRILAIISPWAYLTAACYFLNAAASLLVANELWYRTLLLIIDMLALGSFVWLRLRLRRAAPLISTPNKRAVLDFLLVLAAAVLVTSMGSNVLGNVSLATMLTAAVLDSSYVALVLYAGATVLVALFQVLKPRVPRLTAQNAGSLLQVAARLGRTLLVAAWLVSVLQFFRIYRPLLDWVIAVFSYHIQLGVLSISLGSSAGFLAAAWVAIWLAKTIRLVLSEDLLPKLSLPRGLGNTISTLTYYAILFLGLLTALAIAGFHIGELAIVFGALSVGIGFGLQDVVKNFVSGLILMFERPIQPGDVVDVAGVSGTVRDIGMRATILTTPDGADVVVPNGMLLADKLTNWTLRSSSRRININVVTTYSANPQQTLELLVRIAARVEGIASAPPPVAILTGLATGALEFNLMAWTMDKTDWVGARSLLNVRIRDGLAEAGIEVPLPQRDLHLRSVSRAAAEELPGTRASPPSKSDEGGVGR